MLANIVLPDICTVPVIAHDELVIGERFGRRPIQSKTTCSAVTDLNRIWASAGRISHRAVHKGLVPTAATIRVIAFRAVRAA